MNDTPEYALDDQIGFLLRKANQRHRLIFTTNIEGELAPAQFATLARLHETGPTSQNQLGRSIALDSATITGVVERLTKSGLVSSGRSAKDARLRMIELTPEGRSTIERLLPVAIQITNKTLERLTARESETLCRLLLKISS